MKITINNFFDSVKKAGIDELPEVLQETYALIKVKTDNGKDWKEYKSDSGFKKLVDTACKKMEEFTNANAEELNGTKSNKMDLLELEKRMQTARQEIEEYKTFSHDQLIEILEFIKERIKEEGYKPYLIIRKDALEKLIKEKPGAKSKNKFSEISREVYFIEWFLEFHDTILPKKKLGIFIDELQGAMNKKEIRKSSPVAKDILEIQKAAVAQFNKMGSVENFVLKTETIKKLRDFIVKHQNAKEDVALKKAEPKKKIVGLNGIGESPQTNIISSTDFANMQFSTIGFKDRWLAFMGDPAPGFTAMVFGMPKMGKSYLCVDFANYLSQNHGKVLYVTKEEYLSPTFQLKLKDKNTANENMDIAGELPKDLSAYQFIFLDSVSSMKLTSDQLKELEKNNPGKSFIYVFQVTKAGKARGTNEFMHNVDIVIEVPEKGKAVQFGRYNQGGELNIFPEASDSLPVQDNSAMLDGINKKKPMKNKKDDDDSWTEPEHLHKKDHDDLKTINRLYKSGKFKEAMDKASDVDTIVREEIPGDIWKKIGGTLTPTGEEKLKAQKQKSSPEKQVKKKPIIAFTMGVRALKGVIEREWDLELTDSDYIEILDIAQGSNSNFPEIVNGIDKNLKDFLTTMWEALKEWDKKSGKTEQKSREKFDPRFYDNRNDDDNPSFIFSLTSSKLLAEAIQGDFDLIYLVRRELANRGQDSKGKWVGFDEAKKLHRI